MLVEPAYYVLCAADSPPGELVINSIEYTSTFS